MLVWSIHNSLLWSLLLKILSQCLIHPAGQLNYKQLTQRKKWQVIMWGKWLEKERCVEEEIWARVYLQSWQEHQKLKLQVSCGKMQYAGDSGGSCSSKRIKRSSSTTHPGNWWPTWQQDSVRRVWVCTGLAGDRGVRKLNHCDRAKECEMSAGFIWGKD